MRRCPRAIGVFAMVSRGIAIADRSRPISSPSWPFLDDRNLAPVIDRSTRLLKFERPTPCGRRSLFREATSEQVALQFLHGSEEG